MKKSVAISFVSESGDHYLCIYNDIVANIVDKVLKGFGTEAPYIFVQDIAVLNDKDGTFKRLLHAALSETKLGALDEG